jgi:hypothetical protein
MIINDELGSSCEVVLSFHMPAGIGFKVWYLKFEAGIMTAL